MDSLLDPLNEIAGEIFASLAHVNPDAVQIIGELSTGDRQHQPRPGTERERNREHR